MIPSKSAFGIWSGGKYMRFGESIGADRMDRLVHRAFETGVRTFMTSDVYGQGEADSFLGKALKGINRPGYCLAGMIGHDFYKGERAGSSGFPRFTNPDLRGPSEYKSYLLEATEKSLERLGVDKFDLLMLHNPDSIGYSSDVVWDGMADLKRQGLADSLGVAPGPANGFTLDLLLCFERFSEVVDWAMIILNPMEPWPGRFAIPGAEKFGVDIITRVVDYGGIFHDDVRPGHQFGPSDHRTYRPAGWVEAGNEKLERMRPYAEKYGVTPLQLACLWDLSFAPVKSVVPTLIQEIGENSKSIETKLEELATIPEVEISAEDRAAILAIGDNTGCMALKGGSPTYKGEPVADQWTLNNDLVAIAERWGIEPASDLVQHEAA